MAEVLGVEQHRELIVDGDTTQAIDMCRRLLRTDSNLQRVETAQLVLDRLRSGDSKDSSDDVNALLRLLGNYVAPTRELTEEILSLLLFCEHRVLLIHHLPKLTYQSKECVEVVVQAYLELLATDRSLLVPVLGSLAEMPLDTSEKNTVVEATQSLLDAAVEEDVPAVVQSLLSMVTKSSAPRALARLRSECNRISSETLSLTMEVIGRYAIAGSVALTALLRLLRHVEPLTTFDIILLTYVMGKSAENELAVRTTTSVAQSGRLNDRVMKQTATMIVRPEWKYLLQSFVRFCSCLLAVCFRASTQSKLALNLIATSVDSLVVLVETRSAVHEEALSLLLTIASQPTKLLLIADANSVHRTRSSLCWNVAEAIALRLSELAQRNAGALASSAHLLLDHLHGIASITTESGVDGRYPSHILDLLCSTMALLTKKERGIYSLLLITIQKQLVSRVGTAGLVHDQHAVRLQNGRPFQTRASVVEVKQLMAVFLTGHLLKNQVVVDSRDRKSLANWMLRLLTSANRDETLLHVMRFVRDEMSRTRAVSALEQERALLTSAISQVFRKKGLSWTPRDQVLEQIKDHNSFVLAFGGVKRPGKAPRESIAIPLVVDANEFVLKMRFGLSVTAFCGMDAHDREATRKQVEQEYLIKICLLRELFHCYLEFATLAEQATIADAAFLLPSAYKLVLDPDSCRSVSPRAMNSVIWNVVCSLDIAVASTNFIAQQYAAMSTDTRLTSESVKCYSRMASRLHVCLQLREQLDRILTTQKDNARTSLHGISANTNEPESRQQELEWQVLEVSIVEQLLNGQLRRVQGELPRASLFGLNFQTICFAFNCERKQLLEPSLSLLDESVLLQAFRRHLQTGDKQNFLVMRSEGRSAVKYLCFRSAELSRSISSEDYEHSGDQDDESEVGSADVMTSTTLTRSLMVANQACIYECFVSILEECRISAAAGDTSSSGKMLELLSSGATSDEDLSRYENQHVCSEVFFRFLARQCLEMADAKLTCLAMDALASLVRNTRKNRLLSQLCVAMLHQTFPSLSASSRLEGESDKSTSNGLPIKSLSNTVASPSRGSWCSLAKYRCSSPKWRHVVYLVVGSWAYSTSSLAGTFVLAHYLDEMRILIDAAGTYEEKRNKKKRMRRLDASEDESDEDDLEEQRRQDELAVVVDGEHLVLKNLTNESLPYFIEAILLCAIASLFRAVPNKMNSQGHPDVNPFAEYCHAMLVFETCLQVFAQAETCGFNLPLKTNLLLLRGGAYVTRSVKAIVTKCITWRVEQGVTDTAGELKHLSALFGAAYSMTTTMETVQSGFQDRVVLKMQHDGGGRRRGGWTSELLAKTYGKKYNTRRWISKTEAKLLPFFSHGIQELQDFLQDQSEVNNIELTNARDEWKSGERFWNGLDYRGVMLTDDQLVSACRTLQVEELTPTLLKDWRPVVDKGDSESDYDDEEGKADIQELEEDLLSEDDDDGIDGFAVKSYATDSVNCELNPAMSMPGGRKKPAVELLDNEDVGFPTIVVNFKKHKKAH